MSLIDALRRATGQRSQAQRFGLNVRDVGPAEETEYIGCAAEALCWGFDTWNNADWTPVLLLVWDTNALIWDQGTWSNYDWDASARGRAWETGRWSQQ